MVTRKNFIDYYRKLIVKQENVLERENVAGSSPIFSFFFLPKIIPGGHGIMYVVHPGSKLVAIPMRKLSAT